MNDDLRDFLIKAAVWMTGGAGFLTAVWFLVIALIAAVQVKQPPPVSVPAVAAPEVKRAPTVRVAVPSARVYAPATKADLKLPADALANPNEHVTAAVRVPGSDRPSTVTTTINTETGETRSFVKADPLPWFALEPRGEVRLSLGYKHRNGRFEQVVRLGVGYDIVRIKALTAGVVGTVDSDGSSFVGIGVAYRF